MLRTEEEEEEAVDEDILAVARDDDRQREERIVKAAKVERGNDENEMRGRQDNQENERQAEDCKGEQRDGEREGVNEASREEMLKLQQRDSSERIFEVN